MNPVTKDQTLKAAEKFARQGDLASAIKEYRRVSAADPDDLTVANTLGDLYARTGRTDEAIRHFTRIADGFNAAGQHGKAVAMYKKIAKLDPSNLELGLNLADLYARQSLVGEAKAQYVAVSEGYRRAGDVREALRILKKVADLDPTSVRSRTQLAEAYERDGFASEASDAFRAAGQELLRDGKTAEAVTALTRALDLKPDSRPALKTLAEAYSLGGDVRPALDVIARALEGDPNDIDLIIILGRTFLNAGMVDKAEGTFDRLFALDNSRYDYLLEVARAWVDRGNYDRALAIVDRCVDVILARRHKKKATALLKAILERDPHHVLALKRLAAIYKSVRERRNLVNTLATLVQAALAEDLRAEAVVALRQLVEIEPKKAAYQQQLASLDGEAGAAAAPVEEPPDDGYDSYADYSTELLEDMVAQHPEFLAARLKLLEDLVAQQPAYVEGRVKLKQLYVDGGQHAKAAAQCLELARHHEANGEGDAAKRYLAEAFALDPSLKRPAPSAAVAAAARPAPALDEPRVALSQMLGVEEFEKLFEQEWRRASREPKPLSVLKVRVDRFETYEAEEGPLKSLRCLERVAWALEGEVRRAGQVVASGGDEEFFVLLPETHPGSATSIADAMRKGVEALEIAHPNGRAVTASVGAATAFPYRSTDAGALIAALDTAIAEAQGRGGNRVVSVPLIGA